VARETGTRTGIHLILITATGLAPNAYADELVGRAITADALLA